MRHLVVIVAVICAVIGDGWAQNRGSSRYVPPEDFDGDITRAPRPAPTRGAGVRRQRTTKAPEVAPAEDDLKSHQPPEIPSRTTARRIPQRNSPRQIAPPPPPPVPVEEPAPLYPAPALEIGDSPPTGTEEKPQGTRRRRQKKRRKPQAVVPQLDDEQEKGIGAVSDTDKASISELVNDDRKRTEEFQSNPQLRNSPPTHGSSQNFQPEKSTWESDTPVLQPHRNAAGPQYFRPQPATNRLPVDNSKHIGNSDYLDSSPVAPNVDPSNEYTPKEHASGVRNEASYVPVLNPIRVPSEGASRLPPEHYLLTRNQESNRHESADRNVPFRTQGHRSPENDPNQIIRNAGTRPIHNIIPQPDDSSIPIRGHSEVRLPEDKKPLLSPEYATSDFDTAGGLPIELEPNDKVSDVNEEHSNPTNRLPNPSEVHYESVYPDNPQRIGGRRQEPEIDNVRRTPPSYITPRRESGTKPQEFDNDAEVDRRHASEYQPPLRRTVSRYRPDDLDETSRARTQSSASTPPPRSRGSSRYNPSTVDTTTPERTRSSSRNPVESDDSPYRSRSSSNSHSTSRTRGSQRHTPETIEETPRSSSRRQPENIETPPRRAQYTPPSHSYVPVDEIARKEERAPHTSRITHSPTQSPSNIRAENELNDYGSIRETLRSRPQYEVRDTEPVNSYEDSEEDSPSYQNNYQQPRQTIPRGRTNERTSVTRQAPPQPEYQPPSNRQQTRSESHYEPPQNPRSRQQPQYQAPQNPRTEHRQASPRQNEPSSRQQARPRSQDPEAPAPRGRSTGGSNFKCPDAFGFFADSLQCDKYYECRNGTAEMHLCSDGLGFNEASAPNLRCDSLRDVDCKSRPELQEPQATKNCPRRFGLFAHETDCTKFWNCVDGTATEIQCPPGLSYNDGLGTCDWADLVENSCRTEELLGFTCPEPTTHDLQDGVYTRYPHPDNCQLHFTCIKGTDGLRRPRMLSCNEGLVFDPATSSCKRPDDVPGCEEFYGPRPPPRSKPATRQPARREPEPEEELIEEPTPTPRRRGTNRRTRN